MKNHVRGIFFDLFGTLLVYGDMKSAWAEWLAAFHSALRQHGLLLSLDRFAKECDNFFGKDAPPVEDDGFTVLERRIHSLCSRLGLVLERSEISHTADHIVGVWQQHIGVDPETRSTLSGLQKDKVLGLVSNFDHPRHVRKVLTDHRLDGYFKTIVISGDVGVTKPNPRVFELALLQTSLRPGEVVYVGDTDEDVVGARAAGITPILIRRRGSGTDSNALDFTEEMRAEASESVSSVDTSVTQVGSLGRLLTLFD